MESETGGSLRARKGVGSRVRAVTIAKKNPIVGELCIWGRGAEGKKKRAEGRRAAPERKKRGAETHSSMGVGTRRKELCWAAKNLFLKKGE